MNIYEAISKLGKRIRLTETQWNHIKGKHVEIDNQRAKMILTLEEPDFIYHDPAEENYHYYRNFKETPVTEKHLLLIVKHLNDEGFIITAFFVPKIRTKGKVLQL